MSDMIRIDESEAAKAFVKKFTAGSYPLERARNDGVNYCEEKEKRDTEAVREFIKNPLFEEFKKMK